MDAIVTAGGIPKPEDALYAFTQGASKAMLPVAGKPMIQWVLDALSQAKNIERVVIMGLAEDSGISCTKALTFMPTYGSMLQNILQGIEQVKQINPDVRQVLIVSSDIPAITGEMVDWLVATCLQTDDDLYYNVIPRQVMETRYPASQRTYVRLKDVELCGGDMNVVHTRIATANRETWDKLIEARKNALKQASLVGFDTLLLLLLRAVTLEGAVKRLSRRLHLKGRALVCPYAEVGMDVDKPHQLEILAEDLAKQRS